MVYDRTGANPEAVSSRYLAGGPLKTEFAPDGLRNATGEVKNYRTGAPEVVYGRYVYHYDPLDRRTGVEYSGEAFSSQDQFNLYGYNPRSELTASKRFVGAYDPQRATGDELAQRRGYTYDPIGNRARSTLADAQGNDVDLFYCRNNLNAYTATDTAENCPDPVTEQFTYAPDGANDGNLLGDGTFTYEWDGENRLVAVTPINRVYPLDKQVKFKYDYMSRRVEKALHAWNPALNNGQGDWSPIASQIERYVYDGWNVVLVLNGIAGVNLETEPANRTVKKYYWGLDLGAQASAGRGSAGIQAAGGIGGLLACTEMTGTNAGTYWFFHDANGNVTEIVSDGTWTLAGHYQYDPYGNLVNTPIGYAAVNPIRFSSKWYDPETELYYYIFRYYSPRLGRWVNRDPTGEAMGGLNLHTFVENSPIGSVDFNGLWKIYRNGGYYAYVVADRPDDTIRTLAYTIGLDESEYRKWLMLSKRTETRNNKSISWTEGPLPRSATEPIRKCSAYYIPNTVVAYWGGAFGDFGQFWVMWNADIRTLERRGFKVEQVDVNSLGGIGGKSLVQNFLQLLENRSRSRTLHGLYFWGHGGFCLYTDPRNPLRGRTAVNRHQIHRHLEYRLALGILWGCGMMDEYGNFITLQDPIFTNSPGSIVWGGDSLVVPWPFHTYGRSVEEIVEPGDQGTRGE